MKKYPILIVLVHGFYFGLIASKLIVSTMSKKENEIPTLEVVAYLVSIALAVYLENVFIEIIAFVILSGFILFYYLRYFISIILQLLNYLEISF